jgi:LmbE family N-acetylglucosaminyl deacetylase
MERKAFFAAADKLPLAGLKRLIGDGGVVVIAPHPDDESLGCGALLAAAAKGHVPTRIVVVSDGCLSHPNSRLYPRERLRRTRQEEARDAAQTLGLAVQDVVFLDLPDASVPAAGATAERAAERIAAVANEAGARSLFVTWRHDTHCDHQAAYAMARAAQRMLTEARLFEYSIWGRSVSSETLDAPPPRGWRFPIAVHRERKRAAINAHASQVSLLIDDDPEGFVLPAEIIADCLRRDELFLEMAP